MSKKSKKKKNRYSPGQQIILFEPGKTVCKAWVCCKTRINFRPIFENEYGKTIIKITRNEKDRDTGKGTHLSTVHIQPYSEELWGACAQWLEDDIEMVKRLSKLKRGKY